VSGATERPGAGLREQEQSGGRPRKGKLGLRGWAILGLIVLGLEVVLSIARKLIWGDQVSWQEVLLMLPLDTTMVLTATWALLFMGRRKADDPETTRDGGGGAYEARFGLGGWTVAAAALVGCVAVRSVVRQLLRSGQWSWTEALISCLAAVAVALPLLWYYVHRGDADGGNKPLK